MKIIIFSGTTEGRILSDRLTKDCMPHIVSVASEYGKEMRYFHIIRGIMVYNL